jgi:DNA-binding NarL/FixJ family response regulator
LEKQITTAKRKPDFNPLVGPRERQICELLLLGAVNQDIAKELGMARRTVKAHFNRLFLRFQIHDGIKRVKLAVLLYRDDSWRQQEPDFTNNSGGSVI